MRTRAEALAWAGDGAAHLRGLMTRLGDDAFAAPSALPDWSRAHVLTHVARGADALINLLTWAKTGARTPAYASSEQRDADIAAGAAREPARIRTDVIETSDRLAVAVRGMPEKAWAAVVDDGRGNEVRAEDIPWLRAREVWIHAVDLDVGASFADLPQPMLVELIGTVAQTLGARESSPSMRLVATDSGGREWTLGAGGDLKVSGPGAELVAWLLGRSKGKALRSSAGGRVSPLPRWI